VNIHGSAADHRSFPVNFVDSLSLSLSFFLSAFLDDSGSFINILVKYLQSID
jgi:hypothetical protein